MQLTLEINMALNVVLYVLIDPFALQLVNEVWCFMIKLHELIKSSLATSKSSFTSSKTKRIHKFSVYDLSVIN
jgi:hypothetical protein